MQHTNFKSVSLVAFLLATSLLAGCDWMNPYHAPAVPPQPEAWREAAPAPDDANEKHADWPEGEWWKSFASDELNGFMEEALSANDDLAVAVARVQQANAQATIAGASIFPTLDKTADASRSVAADKANPARRAHGKSFNSGLTAAYELDFWGKNRSDAASKDALADASVFDKETVRLTVTSSVANTYFDWLATRKRIEIAQNNLDAAQKTLDALKKKMDAGVISLLDVSQQETVTANQRAALPPLQLRATQDRDALAILLGRMPESMPEPTGTLESLTMPVVPAGVPSELLLRRPDIARAEANLQSAHADVNAARAAFLPSISLTATSDVASSALDNLFSPGSQLFTYGASATQSLFEGGRLTGQLEYSNAYEEELAVSYHKAIISAFADVEDALAALHQNKEQDDAQRVAESSSKTAADLSQRLFDAGTVDITTLLNTQRSLFSASDARVQTQLARLTAVVGMNKALGGGWKLPEKK